MTPDFDLGTWLGRRQGMATCAARATASEVNCLRFIRDNKLYKATTSSWADFCTKHLGSSKTQVDEDIRNADEFGDVYFHINQLTRTSATTFRAIAPYVSDEGINLHGELIPLTECNIPEITNAIDTLRRELPAAPPKPRPSTARLLRTLESTIIQLEIAALTAEQRQSVTALTRRLAKLIADS